MRRDALAGVHAMDPIHELKVRADILHARLESNDGGALARLRVLPELHRADDATLRTKAADVRRKHCLSVVARECGFASWEHARHVLGGHTDVDDFGTLLHAKNAGGILNQWFASYAEAFAAQRSLPDRPRHYLLAYKRHLLITGPSFVEALGMDPDDPDWEAIGWDWVHPIDAAARSRLYYKRLVAMRR
ncbi:hypothetical protein LVJ94_51500 [Pendulispora rubella]|uniref:Uncharacterized protein n=2 Tax=Pendulispora rubella TaxID=2741070 RepID=A0ABZ2L3K8_9BACT